VASADEIRDATALERELTAAGQTLHRVDAHINDPAFATAMADRLHQMIAEGS
jgi:uncharacterized protein (UPF0261 family)